MLIAVNKSLNCVKHPNLAINKKERNLIRFQINLWVFKVTKHFYIQSLWRVAPWDTRIYNQKGSQGNNFDIGLTKSFISTTHTKHIKMLTRVKAIFIISTHSHGIRMHCSSFFFWFFDGKNSSYFLHWNFEPSLSWICCRCLLKVL